MNKKIRIELLINNKQNSLKSNTLPYSKKVYLTLKGCMKKSRTSLI